MVWHRAFGADVTTNQLFESARGALHISLGRSPRLLSQQEKGLKARSISSFETISSYVLFIGTRGRARTAGGPQKPRRD